MAMIFYLIVLILILLYYFFMAPKTIKNTLNPLVMVGIVVCLMIALVFGVVTFFDMSGEFYVSLAMTLLGFWAVRDMLKMPTKKQKQTKDLIE